MTVTAAPDTEAVYVCVMAHVSDAGAFALEEEVRASHPAVAKNPGLWRLRGTPRSEWPSPYEGAIRQTEERKAAERADERRRLLEEAKRNPVKLSVAATVKAKDDHAAFVDGRLVWILKGSEALADAAHVTANREHWT